MYQFDKMTLKTWYEDAARKQYNKPLNELSPHELEGVISHVVKNNIIGCQFNRSMQTYGDQKVVIYCSIEFLIGKIVLDALNNTGILITTEEIFDDAGVDIHILEEVDDPALGNGGLGRLAACFIESAATLGYPVFGAGLFYKFGLFKQVFDENGNQVEVPDNWTEHGIHWFEAHPEQRVVVPFQDTKVYAVPYIVPVIGHKGKTSHIRFWKAEPIDGVTNESAAAISDWLYPNDKTPEGKKLRIRQEYFFVSAELQTILKNHFEKHGTLDNVEEFYTFQMNDTHPVFGCLEFIRLLQVYGYGFDVAFEKARKMFAYTNHTIMAEALETWEIVQFKDLLPDIFKVIEGINQKLIEELSANEKYQKSTWRDGKFFTEPDWDKIRQYEMFQNGIIYMSRIACYIAFSINGVAKVHTEIIENRTLRDWYELYPYEFNNKTNGVTPRRWITLCHPELAKFYTEKLGTDEWITDMSLLEALEVYKNNPEVLAEFKETHLPPKQRLADYIYRRQGIRLDTNWIFDCQVKRIHEYKRQLMNALRILYFYDQIKKKAPDFNNFYPTVFIVGGKAAPGYDIAKKIIALFNAIQKMVNNDPDVNSKMKVVFLENFNVSYGEKVYAGADFSEQISTAGTEASGTGNMKFMMNGALTIGTSDGANIEIAHEAKPRNTYIFGATVEEFKRNAPLYRHEYVLNANKVFVDLFEYLKGNRNLSGVYWDLVNTLLYNDRYFVIYDLESYVEATLKAMADYAKEQETGDLFYYTAKSFRNAIRSGIFSSDRTIEEYVRDIWHVQRIN